MAEVISKAKESKSKALTVQSYSKRAEPVKARGGPKGPGQATRQYYGTS